MMKNIKKALPLLLLVTVILTPSMVNAQLSKVGTTAAEFLRIPVGARSSAMTAYASTVNDASAMILNPAGLADVTQNEAMIEVTDLYLDFNHTFFGVAVPTKKGVAGVHVLALNYGDFDETTAEAGGLTGRTFNAYSASFGFSYAQYLIPQFTVGGTIKMVYEKIANSSATAVAFDIGTLYETPFDGIRFGVSVTNFGSKLQITGNDLIIASDPDESQEGNYEPDAKLDTDSYDLPLMLKVGLAWDAINNEDIRATISIDGNNPTNNVQSLSIGGELGLMKDQVQIRAGLPYIGQEDATEKFNAGLGVKYSINNSLKLGFNYTYHGYRYLGDVNKLGIQIFF